jgi:hypothetical protein
MHSKAGDTLSSRHVSSCDVNVYSWDVRGDLTLNYMAQIHTSVTLLTSRDLAWSSFRLTCQHASQNFCCRTHFVRRDVRVERSSDVTSCFQKWWKHLLEKVGQRTFLYDTKSPDYKDQHMRANAWEGIGKELKIKRKFYVSSRDVRIVCPRLKAIMSCVPAASVHARFPPTNLSGQTHARKWGCPASQRVASELAKRTLWLVAATKLVCPILPGGSRGQQ